MHLNAQKQQLINNQGLISINRHIVIEYKINMNAKLYLTRGINMLPVIFWLYHWRMPHILKWPKLMKPFATNVNQFAVIIPREYITRILYIFSRAHMYCIYIYIYTHIRSLQLNEELYMKTGMQLPNINDTRVILTGLCHVQFFTRTVYMIWLLENDPIVSYEIRLLRYQGDCIICD